MRDVGLPLVVFVSVNRPHRLVVAVSRVVQMRPELGAHACQPQCVADSRRGRRVLDEGV